MWYLTRHAPVCDFTVYNLQYWKCARPYIFDCTCGTISFKWTMLQSSVLPRERAWKTNALCTLISTLSLECLICFMCVFLSVCLLQVRFVYPCVTSYHFYAPTKATRILGRPTTSPIQMASLISMLWYYKLFDVY